MKKYMSWYSIDAGVARDPKIDCLPDNDYRWAWICLLGLEKLGELEGQNVQMFAKHCNVEAEKFDKILSTLRKYGLLTDEGRPKDFQEWQDKAQRASRNKRYHNKKVSPPISDGRKTVVRLSDTDTETNTETKKHKRSGKPSRVSFKNEAKEVLEYLNSVNGRNQTYTKEIESCFKRENCTVQDCKEVIDFKWKEWGHKDEMAARVDATTLFRASNFQRYLDEARAGAASTVSKEQQDYIDFNSDEARAARVALIKE